MIADTMLDPGALKANLRRIVFRLEWEEDGVPCQGTGFFIHRNGQALTAFHNLPRAVRDDPGRPLYGTYEGVPVPLPFRWALTTNADCRWQRELEVAVLQLDRKLADDLPTLDMCRLDPSLTRQQRQQFWDGKPVAAFGFPVRGREEGELILGTVCQGSPLQDVQIEDRWISDHEGSLALSEDFQLKNGSAAGLSGSPLWCRDRDGICGVVFAARPDAGRVYATEFRHIFAHWQPFGDCADEIDWQPDGPSDDDQPRNRRSGWRPGRIAAGATAAAAVAGLLAWRPWSPIAGPPRDSPPAITDRRAVLQLSVFRYPEPVPQGAKIIIHEAKWEPVQPGIPFRPDELLKFSVSSPDDGYLYVFDCERYAGGRLSRPMLIYPSPTMSGHNRVSKGAPLQFPAKTDTPPYMRVHRSRNDHDGEILTLLIMEQPLPVQPGSYVSTGDFRAWAGETEALPAGMEPKMILHPPGGIAKAKIIVPVNIVTGSKYSPANWTDQPK
jgi:hypothetical protein